MEQKSTRTKMDDTELMERLPDVDASPEAPSTAAVKAHERTERYPIPTSDPNDPLIWKRWHKVTTYATICMFSFIANVNGSNFTVAIVPLEKEFGTDSTKATFLVGFNVLLFGLGNVLWVPLMRVVGKRPVYLLALSVFVAANAWSAKATSWGSLLAARMVSGFGAAAADATVPSVVTDMFYLDERGHYMMFFHFALASGIFVGPLINAWIVQLVGWRWSCGFLAITGGAILVAAIFLIRETQFDREAHRIPVDANDAASDDDLGRRRYRQWLHVKVGYNRDKPARQFFNTLRNIVQMASYPSVLWVGCLIGLYVGWTIVMQVTASQIFLKPPYRWVLGEVGLFSLAGWLGVATSFYFGGKLIDFMVKRAMAQDDAYRPKPQVRLIALIVPALLCPSGLILYGQCMAHKTLWVGQAFGYAMHSFGFTAVSNIAVTYAVDCYQDFAGEALVTVFVIRNTIAVVCSFYSNQWIADDGLQVVFGVMAALEWALLAFAIPVYLFSDMLLAFTNTYGPMRKLREDY